MSKSKFFTPNNWTILKFLLKFLSKNSEKNTTNNEDNRNINQRSFYIGKNRPKLQIDLPSPLRSLSSSPSSSSSNKNKDQCNNHSPNLSALICRTILAILFILIILLQFLWSSWCLWFQMNSMDPLFKMALFTPMTFIDSYLFYHVLLWLISLTKLMKKKTHQYLIERRKGRRRTPPELQTPVTTPMSALTLQSLSLVSNYFDVTPTTTPTMIISTINVRLAQDQNDDDETGYESIKFIDDSKSTMNKNSNLTSIERKSSVTSSLSSVDMLANYLNQFDISYLRKQSQDLVTGEKLTTSKESLATECSKFYCDSMP